MVRFTLFIGLLTASLLFAPIALRAETLVIRNQTGAPLTVQSACVLNGMVRPQRPVFLTPGGVLQMTLPGNKLISVYDPRLPNRVLFQTTIGASIQNRAFVLSTQATSGNLKLDPVRIDPQLVPEPTPAGVLAGGPESRAVSRNGGFSLPDNGKAR